MNSPSGMVPFVKASACGNDFLIIDGLYAPADLSSFTRRICDRHSGVGQCRHRGQPPGRLRGTRFQLAGEPPVERSHRNPHGRRPVAGEVAENVPVALHEPILGNDADGIADTRGIDLDELPFRSKFENVGAMMFVRMSVGIVYVRTGPDRDEELCSVGRKSQIACPMAAAGRKLGDDCFSRSARFQVAILIRKPHHRIGVANVNPLRVVTQRIKSDAKRTV